MAHILCSGPESIIVDKITTDTDGRMAQGMSEVMMAYNGTQTETFLNTIDHLNRSVAAAAAVSQSKIKLRLYHILSQVWSYTMIKIEHMVRVR